MKFFKKLLFILVLVFIGIQFISTTNNSSNDVLDIDFSSTLHAPNDVMLIFEISCYDCHSNNTNYPWYNKIQPIKWIMANHIKSGKKELNMSEFGAYSNRRKKSKLKSISKQIENEEMPLSSYLVLHRDAKISEKDKKRIIDWVNKKRDSLQ